MFYQKMREAVTGSTVHIDPSCRCTAPLYSTENEISFRGALVFHLKFKIFGFNYYLLR